MPVILSRRNPGGWGRGWEGWRTAKDPLIERKVGWRGMPGSR
jgi:hypothetical protein